MKCNYCGVDDKSWSIGWHGCPSSLAAKDRLGYLLSTMHAKFAGTYKQTDEEKEQRAKATQTMATTIKIMGGEVKV